MNFASCIIHQILILIVYVIVDDFIRLVVSPTKLQHLHIECQLSVTFMKNLGSYKSHAGFIYFQMSTVANSYTFIVYNVVKVHDNAIRS